MVNRRKDMVYYVIWIERLEEKLMREILKKEKKTEKDLRFLGEIIVRINAKGDLKLK